MTSLFQTLLTISLFFSIMACEEDGSLDPDKFLVTDDTGEIVGDPTLDQGKLNTLADQVLHPPKKCNIEGKEDLEEAACVTAGGQLVADCAATGICCETVNDFLAFDEKKLFSGCKAELDSEVLRLQGELPDTAT